MRGNDHKVQKDLDFSDISGKQSEKKLSSDLTVNAEKKSPKHSSKNADHIENIVYGFATGFIIGGTISGFEFTKVKMQANAELSLRSMCSRHFVQNNWKGFVSTVPTFAMFFGGACAIEFSANSIIAEEYGPAAGLCASAGSGAAWLTIADHMMYQKEKGISYFSSSKLFFGSFRGLRYAFTGFIPMTVREFLFGLSVLYTGPLIAQYFKDSRKNGYDTKLDLWWQFVGIGCSAMITTTVSQPFDTLTRQMQMAAYGSRGSFAPRFFDIAAKNMNFTVLYRGFAPRFVLASVGAASIGTLFKFFKQNNTHTAQLDESKNITRPTR